MDLELVEAGNGGDLIKNKNDLSVIFGFENMIYLAICGGNRDQSTPTKRLPTEQAFDFWANNLIMQNDASIQFNSLTERILNQTVLSSSGRVKIEQAVKRDLAFMQDFAEVTVKVEIISDDKLIIGVRLQQPGNIQNRDFIYIWDATNQELINRENIDRNSPNVIPQSVWDFTFDYTFRGL